MSVQNLNTWSICVFGIGKTSHHRCDMQLVPPPRSNLVILGLTLVRN